jgi:hypothetical protein
MVLSVSCWRARASASALAPNGYASVAGWPTDGGSVV